jgi:tRNA pseudouridine38/39 synthase
VAAEAELQYVRMLNAVLPPEIRVFAWAAVPPEFEARFSCTSRMYKYYFVRRGLNIEAWNLARHLYGN